MPKSRKRALLYVPARITNEMQRAVFLHESRWGPQMLALQRCALNWLIPCPSPGRLLDSYNRMVLNLTRNDEVGRVGMSLFSQIDLMLKRGWLKRADYEATIALLFGDENDPPR